MYKRQSQDEALLPGWDGCGLDGPACTQVDGRYQLQLTVPMTPTGPCYLQIDAILGRPLAVVGPSGSFYSGILRPPAYEGPSMLVSAMNFGTDCTVPETPTVPDTQMVPETPTVTETPAVPEAPTTTTTPDSPDTPVVPTAVEVSPVSATVAPAAQPATAVMGETVSRSTTQATLPVTGTSSTPWMAAAAALIAAGAGLVARTRRLAHREP